MAPPRQAAATLAALGASLAKESVTKDKDALLSLLKARAALRRRPAAC